MKKSRERGNIRRISPCERARCWCSVVSADQIGLSRESNIPTLSPLRNPPEYGLDDTAPFFREISPKIPHHLRKIRPQHEMQSQTRRLCVPAASYHRIKKLQCIFCDVIPRNEDKSRIQDRFAHGFHRLKMTNLLRAGPRHRKYNGSARDRKSIRLNSSHSQIS